MDDGTPDEGLMRIESVAVGGAGVAHDDTGRVVFVDGGVPGDTVEVRIDSRHKRHSTGTAVGVSEPSPDRIAPVCPHVLRGCGGCGWAHVDLTAQRRLKLDIVSQALTRIGGLDAPTVVDGPALPDGGHRTTVRAGVVDGGAAFRRAHGHDLVDIDSCRVAHPLVEEILVEGRFGDAEEVTVRVGAATGEQLVVVSPTVGEVDVPSGVLVVGADELRAGRRAWIHDEVAGTAFRISAESFFQTRPDGAEALVAAVADALDGLGADAPLADLYCGVGLFAATVGRGRPVVAVERSHSSVADARINLSSNAKVVRSSVERWRPSQVAAVVADPARHGLARAGVDTIDATGATHLALVSCDAGALGRDAGLLAARGWRHDGSTVIDMFPDTPHVEVVTRFVR